MAQYNISQSTTTDLNTTALDYSVPSRTPEGAQDQKETYYDNPYWTKYFGYYKQIPEYKTAINGYATWVVGKGWTADSRTTAILENIIGWGEDTFQSILWNMIVVKKVGGDAFAEIIRNDDGTIINLKTLDPSRVRIVADSKGLIKRYDYRKTGPNQLYTPMEPNKILHLCNDRIADEIHGTSITESVEWVILARNEAMDTQRKLMRRNLALGILEVDTEDTTKRNNLKTEYRNAIKNGEVLVLPKGVAEMKDSKVNIQDMIPWIKYLENFFYQAIGVPKVILGGSEEFTEASSKIGYLTFEQKYMHEIEQLKSDLWNQCAIRVEFNKPASIKNELLQSEEKNTGQTGFQPKEATATLTRE